MRPTASLSLDLDNKWSYMKTHGDAGWETFPSYLDDVVPRFLSILAAWELRITVFVVGQDAAIEKNHGALRSIAQAGHEIGNHSFHHEPWLHLYSREELDAEIARAEHHIEQATGERPTGFRGPGFSVSPTTLQVLAARGYAYDASTFPTFLGPLARAYFFMTANIKKEEQQQRKNLFGSVRDGFRPLRPYQWDLGEQQLTEVPVTTMPIIKAPFHLSYLLFLAQYSQSLAIMYFRIAMALCKLTGIEPSLLLHPLDFMGADDDTDLSYFPGMRLPAKSKVQLVERVLDIYQQQFTVVAMDAHVDHIESRWESGEQRLHLRKLES